MSSAADRCQDCARFFLPPQSDSMRGPMYNCRAFKIMVRADQAVCGHSLAKARHPQADQGRLWGG